MKVRALYQSLIAKYKSNWKWYVIIAVAACAVLSITLPWQSAHTDIVQYIADYISGTACVLPLQTIIVFMVDFAVYQRIERNYIK